jgi:hypothetical protein
MPQHALTQVVRYLMFSSFQSLYRSGRPTLLVQQVPHPLHNLLSEFGRLDVSWEPLDSKTMRPTTPRNTDQDLCDEEHRKTLGEKV